MIDECILTTYVWSIDYVCVCMYGPIEVCMYDPLKCVFDYVCTYIYMINLKMFLKMHSAGLQSMSGVSDSMELFLISRTAVLVEDPSCSMEQNRCVRTYTVETWLYELLYLRVSKIIRKRWRCMWSAILRPAVLVFKNSSFQSQGEKFELLLDRTCCGLKHLFYKVSLECCYPQHARTKTGTWNQRIPYENSKKC